MITRAYLTIGDRRVHYRRCGSGPPLLMIHQSPRSSAEYEMLMREWGKTFTCIAPDTPGFGQSVPLANQAPEIYDFADAILEFADAVGIGKIAGYGFHSGGILLVNAMKRHPDRFAVLAIGGYAIWNEEERQTLGEVYIPPNPVKPYGEHLVWLWNRILEQSWYFPWYAPQDATRMPGAHDDPARVHAIILEMLASGDFYRLGYGAVLRGPRDIPPPESLTAPVLITAYDGDPLKAHIERLGALPAGWEAHPVATPAEHQAESLAFLRTHAPKERVTLRENSDQGFLPVKTSSFDGIIHWLGDPASGMMRIHGPGREAELLTGEMVRIDLPGHGLSDDWPDGSPEDWQPWHEVIDAVAKHFGIDRVEFEPLQSGDPARLFPDLTPDRFGNYLTTAWAVVRAQHIYSPWYAASKDNAIPLDPAALDPERLAKEHRALIRGTAARAFHIARQNRETE